jgi:hypothetical protein
LLLDLTVHAVLVKTFFYENSLDTVTKRVWANVLPSIKIATEDPGADTRHCWLWGEQLSKTDQEIVPTF